MAQQLFTGMPLQELFNNTNRNIEDAMEKQAAFVTAFRHLKNRIDTFVNLPMSSIDSLSLGTKLREIGRSDGATRPEPKAS